MLSVFTLISDAVDTADVIDELLAPTEVASGDAVAGLLFATSGYDLGAIIASSSDVLAAAVASLDHALAGLAGPPEALLVFSCAARQTVLGIKTDGERAGIRARLHERGWGDVPIAGFYGYGEIGGGLGEAPRFHNETCVIVALGSTDG